MTGRMRVRTIVQVLFVWLLTGLGVFLASCHTDISLDLILQPAASVGVHEISAGPDRGQIADGWTLRFAKYIVSIGDVAVSRDDGSDPIAWSNTAVVDLVSVPSQGVALAHLGATTEGHHAYVSYAIVPPTASALRHPSVTADTFAMMQSARCAYYVEGELTNPDGRVHGVAHTHVTFRFCVGIDVTFAACANDFGVQGITLASGRANVLALTVHADHLVYPGFSTRAGLTRMAQWLANGDVNLDGEVTQQELEATTPEQLFADARAPVTLSGSPITPLRNGWDYLRAQFATQGHINGDSDCMPNVRSDPRSEP